MVRVLDGVMAAEQREAEAIRLQLVELSEHILRRLAIVLSRARAHSRHAYDQVEATARDITNVQREMMEELARPVARREELAMLTALMRVQDRSMTVLEQLERLPFNEPAARLKPIPPSDETPRRRFESTPEIAPWSAYDDMRTDPGPPGGATPAAYQEPIPPTLRPSRRPPAAPPVPPLATPVARLQTQSSVGQPFPAMPGQAPVRSGRPPPRGPAPEAPRPRKGAAPGRPAPPRSEPPADAAETQALALVETSAKGQPVHSAGERMQRAAGRAWDVVVRVPQVVLTVTFLAVGLVLVVLLGRMFFVVADGLNTKRGDPQAIEKSEERLPSDDKTAGGARPLVLPPGDGFVVVLSMHPDQASARKTYAEMQQRMPTVLASLNADIQPMETQNGLRYRLALSPALPRERAFALCAELKSNGFPACWLRRLQR